MKLFFHHAWYTSFRIDTEIIKELNVLIDYKSKSSEELDRLMRRKPAR